MGITAIWASSQGATPNTMPVDLGSGDFQVLGDFVDRQNRAFVGIHRMGSLHLLLPQEKA